MLLQRLDQGQVGAATLKTLAQRYELQALDDEEMLLRVTIDDAQFPQEAVVRLASALDEIDRDWQACFDWPKAD